MNKPKALCEKCGQKAIVHIRLDAGDNDSFHHYCLNCADALQADALNAVRSRGLGHAAILLTVGLLVLVISIAADSLAFGRSEGFGPKQQLGVALAGVLLAAGAMFRVSALIVIGLISGLITFLADRLGFGSAAGFGYQQILGCLVGAAMITLGIVKAMRTRRISSQPVAPEKP